MNRDVTFRIAIDIGGTFTDCVVLPSEGQRVTTKALTTTGNQAQGVIDCLEMHDLQSRSGDPRQGRGIVRQSSQYARTTFRRFVEKDA